MKLRAVCLLVYTAIFALTVRPLASQVTGATLVGTITDASGSVIPDAQIDVLRVSTGTHRQVSSNESGSYTIPNLQSGTYTVTVTAPSFGKQVTSGLTLAVGQNIERNFVLKAGAATEQVTVTSTTPPLDLTNSQISNVVDSTTVRQLPLNTRDWTLLATLQPGVSQIRTEKAVAVGADRGNRGFGAQLTIAGGRPQQNNYRMDGISINDYSNGAPGSVAGENLGVDAIQEFSVVTANASAEYGREAGGVINAVSRAGTNQFHGTVFEFFRNDALDARDYFNIINIAATANPITARQSELRKNQFGVALGGPILKDKLFFFGTYEGIRQIFAPPTVVNAPSASARNGILVCTQPTAASGNPQNPNCDTTIGGAQAAPGATGQQQVAVSAATANYLKFYGVPTTATSNPDVGTYTFALRQVTPENFYQGRVDYVLSPKDSAHITYAYDSGNYTQPDALNNYLLLSDTRRQLGLIEETHVFSSSFVNSARAGINRNIANITNTAAGSNALAADTTLGEVPGRTASSLVISGLTTFGGGLNAPSQYNFYWTSIQAYDDAFYTFRNHTFRFGVAAEHMANSIIATSSPAGLFTFSSVEDFIAGRVQNFSAQLPGSIPEKQLRQWLAGGYLLDDWKLRTNLTVNVGLRYEATTVPTEEHNHLSRLVNLTDTAPTLGGQYFSNPTLKDFEPRIGLAYDPFKNGKSVIRAGFGIFDVLPLPYQFELLSALAAPYLQVGSVVYSNTNNGIYNGTQPGDGKFLNPTTFASIAAPSALRQSYIQPNPSRNYLMEWNLNVENDLGHNFSTFLGFVGSKGVHQPFRTDEVNTVQPLGYLNGGQLTFPKPGTAPVLNPSVGQIAAIFYNNNTYYSGLQAGLTHKMSHGLQFQASYTYSKAIDLGSAILAGDPFGNSVSGLFFFAPGTRRGVADFNVPQLFSFNYLYEAPAVKGLNAPLNAVVNGWQLGGIYIAQSGLPFTPTIAGDPLGLKGTAPYSVPNRIKSASGCGTATLPRAGVGKQYVNLSCFTFPTPNADGTTVYGNAGRNSLQGPRLNSLDFSLVKNTHLSERVNMQFRAEAYNALNHPNLAPPIGNRTLFAAGGGAQGNAGVITTDVIPNRQIQFGLKMLF